ncbi:coiled-coil domain-containing protein 33 isoform X2 [Pangasianodon hypophthalmus]|uniref:coiled-coil domain-containing protein 33 isoform X2 n=1 Tax=Pangasianodon hypophthalmus TaxID=310915 RepID=UPI00230785E1|nr:coiled-coil domain-containing protein 33 isoform X2 [Pangasianodon hypophthalmus]
MDDDFFPLLGFCKNDRNHDVRLKVEAIRVTDSEVKAGEGFFAIYPRTNAPQINLYAEPGEELYQYSGIMALLRVQNDYLAMHCGRLLYSVALHEAKPISLHENNSSCLPLVKKEKLYNRDHVPWPCSAHVDSLVSLEQQRGTLDLQKSQDTEYTLPSLWLQVPILNTEPDAKIDSSRERLPSSPRSATDTAQLKTKTEPDLSGLALFPHEHTPSQSPEPFPYIYVTESPLRKESAFLSPLCPPHVSQQGHEIISVTLHGATSLPLLIDGGVPLPFAIVSTIEDGTGRWRSQAVTHCALESTHNPCWEENLSVELVHVEGHREDVVINIADGPSKELLAHFRMPSSHLEPFQHYHLELVQPHRAVPSGVRVYVTMVRKLSLLPRLPCFSFTGFEVLLQSIDSPLKDPVGPLLAVASIVADYDSYRETMLLHVPRAACVGVMSVPFPQPPESVFTLPVLTAQGQPQISQPGSPEEQPVWNHCFLFLGRDCATAFTPGAALVLEYYPKATVMNTMSWHLRNPVAFSALSLNQQLYSSLMSERGQKGLRLQCLPLQGGSLQTISDTSPSVSLVLRLIGSERPVSTLSQVDCSLLPCVQLALQDELFSALVEGELEVPHTVLELEQSDSGDNSSRIENHTLHKSTLQRDGYDLPAYDALAQILPEYQHIFKTPKAPQQSKGEPKEQKKSKRSLELNQTFEIHSPHERLPVPTVQADDPHVAEITEHQTKELENYRTAMCKMAEDILALRSQVASLEEQNSQLRSELSMNQDLGRTLLDDTDIDVMTKAEIADRIVSLKCKLASESSKAADQRDKIQQLQNELIRKNDNEKELVRLQRAHQQQQAVLQRYQGQIKKVSNLEATIRQQEKVIERMEKVLTTKLGERNKENAERKKKVLKEKVSEESRMKEIETILAAENSRLRAELERLRQQPQPIIIQQPAQQPFADSEKLRLLEQLERAEVCIHTLGKQLEENARQWGKEKQDMLTRLSEYNHGFARTSTLHHLPLKTVSDSILGHIRHKQLDTLK